MDILQTFLWRVQLFLLLSTNDSLFLLCHVIFAYGYAVIIQSTSIFQFWFRPQFELLLEGSDDDEYCFRLWFQALCDDM